MTARLSADQLRPAAVDAILLESAGSSEACERLVKRALDNGGRDNVTVIVAAYRLPDDPAPSNDDRRERSPA